MRHVMTSLASRCREARQWAGFAPEDLANRLGLPISTTLGYEDALWPRRRELPILRRWAHMCDVDEDWLVYGTAPSTLRQ